MSVFKCKMCGGNLEITEDMSVCECEYCGTKQTVPRLDSDRKANLYDRANHFRRNNDYDKAIGIYEQILNEDNTDAEAYWSLVLCRYGIEYVEDPQSHKRIPTVNRAQFTSIYMDEDYKSALKYADAYQKTIYEEEAKAIDDIQKGILEISSNEDPFDVFICYKETDANGRRTQDSVLANDLYHQLTQEGFKVFFSRITLEDKLGMAYEPYIFAALNSAKVMVVLGTRPEYFSAVWVKNEWSRYLALVKNSGGKKTLIPAYRDMDPYDLPEEFSHLQAQDMSKLGFMQDLIRGIKKVIVKEDTSKHFVETTVVQNAYAANVQALLDRGQMALEDSEWDKADGFYEEVLNQDAKCADAYVGKLLAANQVSTLDKYFTTLKNKYSTATSEKLYACAEESSHIRSMVKEYVLDDYLQAEEIRKQYNFDRQYDSVLSCRKEQKSKQLAELEADKVLTRVKQYSTGNLKQAVETGLTNLHSLLDVRINDAQREDEKSIADIVSRYQAHIENADKKVIELREKADNRKYAYYESCIKAMNNATSIFNYQKVYDQFTALGSYENSSDYAEKCKAVIRELEEKDRRAAEAARRAKTRKIKIISIAGASLVIGIIAFFVVTKVVIPNNKYNSAVSLMNEGKYAEAMDAFDKLDGYKNSSEKIQECQNGLNYEFALALMNEGKYDEAIKIFTYLSGYKDSAEQVETCRTALKEVDYKKALTLMDEGNYNEAIAAFSQLNGYKDSAEQIVICQTAKEESIYNDALVLLEDGKYDDALKLIEGIRKNDVIDLSKEESLYNCALVMLEKGEYEKAYRLLEIIEKNDAIMSNKYDRAVALIASGDYKTAYFLLKGMDYKDSKDLIESIKLQHPEAALYEATIGAYVKFGAYEQDNDTSNGKEDIEWLVLAREGNRFLVISRYGLDFKKYNTTKSVVNWEKCSLRKWLNETFFNDAFSENERARIPSVTVRVDDEKPRLYDWDPGNSTLDRVFLLSIKEVNWYFGTDISLDCSGTAYERAKGDRPLQGTCSWWLRSPGSNPSTTTDVVIDIINSAGHDVSWADAVRPAMWIDIGV